MFAGIVNYPYIFIVKEVECCPGREFLVAFSQNRPVLGSPSPRLYVTSSSNQPVDVTVSLPGMSVGLLWPAAVGPPFYQSTYRLPAIGQGQEIDFPSALQLLGTNIENKGKQENISLETRCLASVHRIFKALII